HNAAEASALKRDASRMADEIKYISARIEARRKVLLDDPFYAEAITALQAILNTLRDQLTADRADSHQSLKAVEEAFTASAPSVEKLPQSQRELASQIAQGASAVEKARRAFAAALAAGDPQ